MDFNVFGYNVNISKKPYIKCIFQTDHIRMCKKYLYGYESYNFEKYDRITHSWKKIYASELFEPILDEENTLCIKIKDIDLFNYENKKTYEITNKIRESENGYIDFQNFRASYNFYISTLVIHLSYRLWNNDSLGNPVYEQITPKELIDLIGDGTRIIFNNPSLRIETMCLLGDILQDIYKRKVKK